MKLQSLLTLARKIVRLKVAIRPKQLGVIKLGEPTENQIQVQLKLIDSIRIK